MPIRRVGTINTYVVRDFEGLGSFERSALKEKAVANKDRDEAVQREKAAASDKDAAARKNRQIGQPEAQATGLD